MNKLIETRGLGYTRGGATILSDISFQLLSNERLAVIGSNGAGKSTLFGLLLDDFAPTAGTVQYYPGKKQVLHDLGVVYDKQVLFPLLTVAEIAAYFSKVYKVDPASYSHLVDSLYLGKVWKRHIYLLSQGERMKVALLLALLHRPGLLFLDEPFTNVDPTAVDSLWQTIRSTNATVAYTTHDWELAERTADRILLLHEGRMLHAPASPEQLIDQLPHRRKLVVAKQPEIKRVVADYPHFERKGQIIVLSDEPALLSAVQNVTFNYSFLACGLKDVYHYLLSQNGPAAEPALAANQLIDQL